MKAYDMDALEQICKGRSQKAKDAFEQLKGVVLARREADWVDPELQKAWTTFTKAAAEYNKLANACSVIEAALE